MAALGNPRALPARPLPPGSLARTSAPLPAAPAPAFPARVAMLPLPGLRPAETRRVESAPWFSSLSPALRQAILSRARAQHVRRGAHLVRRNDAATDWIGVAGGALALATNWRDGRAFTLDLLGPGDWFGDIALMDGSAVDLDIVAQAHSTVLMVSRASLHELMDEQPELRQALLQLDCRRLRHMFRRLEEVQTLPLAQRVALQLQRLLRQFGRPAPGALTEPPVLQIELTLTQGDLAALLAASRQRINGVLRLLQAEGILGCSHGRIEVPDVRRLDDVAQGRLVLDGSAG